MPCLHGQAETLQLLPADTPPPACLPACPPARRWAQLDVDGSWPEADRRAHKMVMNIGRRPTFEDAEPELRWVAWLSSARAGPAPAWGLAISALQAGIWSMGAHRP